MGDNTPPLVYVDLYEGRIRKFFQRAQRWRWRALNAGNRRVLAVSSEAYFNQQDAIDTIEQLFGPGTTVYLRQAEHGNQLLRLAAS